MLLYTFRRMEQMYMAPEEFSSWVGWKKDLYDLLTVDSKFIWNYNIVVDLFLPPINKTPLKFIRQIIAKEKKVLYLRIIRRLYDYIASLRQLGVALGSQTKSDHFCNCSNYKELGVSKIWNYILQIKDLIDYFPDYQNNELPEREFMWTVLATLRSEATSSLIEDARKSRSIKNDSDKSNMIAMASEFLAALMNINKQKSILDLK